MSTESIEAFSVSSEKCLHYAVDALFAVLFDCGVERHSIHIYANPPCDFVANDCVVPKEIGFAGFTF